MKIFRKNGKYGAKEGIRVIVPAEYDSLLDMIERDPYFTKNQEGMQCSGKEKVEQESF